MEGYIKFSLSKNSCQMGFLWPVLINCFTLGSWSSDAEPLQDDPALEEGYCDAILCRLRFRKVAIICFSFVLYTSVSIFFPRDSSLY